jgi:hypothetical protein
MDKDNKAAQGQQRINIEIPPDLEAVYANFAVITHSASELIVDFATLLPNMPRSKVAARIIMTPMNAKLLQRALTTNLENYEAQFGEIHIPDGGGFNEDRPIGFRHS